MFLVPMDFVCKRRSSYLVSFSIVFSDELLGNSERLGMLVWFLWSSTFIINITFELHLDLIFVYLFFFLLI